MVYAIQQHISVSLTDLNPILVGEAQCPPSKKNLPDSQKSTLIHYVRKGKGTLYARGGAHQVLPGQAFIILPDEYAYYESDAEDPWEYCWLGFTGELSREFSVLPPVFDAPEGMFSHIKNMDDPSPNLVYELVSDLFLLYAQMVQAPKQRKDFIHTIIDYIQNSYMQKLTLKDIARQVGMNPDYLSRVFHKKTGTTLQAHILDVRITEAKRCLMHGFSVKESALRCGFTDPSTFTRLFKRCHGISPTQWKKAFLKQTADKIS